MIVAPKRKRAKTTQFFSYPVLLAALWVGGCTTSALDLTDGLSPTVAANSALGTSTIARSDDSDTTSEITLSSSDIEVPTTNTSPKVSDAEKNPSNQNQALAALQKDSTSTAFSSAQIATNTPEQQSNIPVTESVAQAKPTSLVAALFGSQPKSPAAIAAIKQSGDANTVQNSPLENSSQVVTTKKAEQTAANDRTAPEQAVSTTKASKADTSTVARLFSSGSGSNATVNSGSSTAKSTNNSIVMAAATAPLNKSASTTTQKAAKQQNLARDYDYVLPGVRANGGLEIRHRASIYDDSDIDADETDFGAPVTLASAGGMARNGLKTQHKSVQVACLKPKLVSILKNLERHYRKPVLITSGYRSPAHNKRVRGAKRSQHMACAAADIQVQGVSKWEVARHLRSLPGRGGVGTYCHTESIHVDIGPERDWNWRCRR